MSQAERLEQGRQGRGQMPYIVVVPVRLGPARHELPEEP